MWFGCNFILADRNQILRAANHTSGGATNLEMRQLTHRLKLKHEVESRNFQNPNISHAEHIGDCFQSRTRQPALLLLSTPQQRYHSAGLTAFREFSHLSFGPGLIGGRESERRGLVCM